MFGAACAVEAFGGRDRGKEFVRDYVSEPHFRFRRTRNTNRNNSSYNRFHDHIAFLAVRVMR
jgi:hypothetical protein